MLESPLQLGSRRIRRISEIRSDVPGDAGTMNVAESLLERSCIERRDGLIGRQQPHSIGAAKRGDRLKHDTCRSKGGLCGLDLDHIPNQNVSDLCPKG